MEMSNKMLIPPELIKTEQQESDRIVAEEKIEMDMDQDGDECDRSSIAVTTSVRTVGGQSYHQKLATPTHKSPFGKITQVKTTVPSPQITTVKQTNKNSRKNLSKPPVKMVSVKPTTPKPATTLTSSPAGTGAPKTKIDKIAENLIKMKQQTQTKKMMTTPNNYVTTAASPPKVSLVKPIKPSTSTSKLNQIKIKTEKIDVVAPPQKTETELEVEVESSPFSLASLSSILANTVNLLPPLSPQPEKETSTSITNTSTSNTSNIINIDNELTSLDWLTNPSSSFSLGINAISPPQSPNAAKQQQQNKNDDEQEKEEGDECDNNCKRLSSISSTQIVRPWLNKSSSIKSESKTTKTLATELLSCQMRVSENLLKKQQLSHQTLRVGSTSTSGVYSINKPINQQKQQQQQQKADASRQFSSSYRRPIYSFSCLTFLAIEASEKKRASVKEIYAWIIRHFPYYRQVPSGSWKNSIRHNLSYNQCFAKVDKNQLAMRDFSGKGSLWCINPVFRPHLVDALQRTYLLSSPSSSPSSSFDNNNSNSPKSSVSPSGVGVYNQLLAQLPVLRDVNTPSNSSSNSSTNTKTQQIAMPTTRISNSSSRLATTVAAVAAAAFSSKYPHKTMVNPKLTSILEQGGFKKAIMPLSLSPLKTKTTNSSNSASGKTTNSTNNNNNHHNSVKGGRGGVVHINPAALNCLAKNSDNPNVRPLLKQNKEPSTSTSTSTSTSKNKNNTSNTTVVNATRTTNNIAPVDQGASEMEAVSALLSMKARSSSTPLVSSAQQKQKQQDQDHSMSSNRHGRRKQLFRPPVKRTTLPSVPSETQRQQQKQTMSEMERAMLQLATVVQDGDDDEYNNESDSMDMTDMGMGMVNWEGADADNCGGDEEDDYDFGEDDEDEDDESDEEDEYENDGGGCGNRDDVPSQNSSFGKFKKTKSSSELKTLAPPPVNSSNKLFIKFNSFNMPKSATTTSSSTSAKTTQQTQLESANSSSPDDDGNESDSEPSTLQIDEEDKREEEDEMKEKETADENKSKSSSNQVTVKLEKEEVFFSHPANTFTTTAKEKVEQKTVAPAVEIVVSPPGIAKEKEEPSPSTITASRVYTRRSAASVPGSAVTVSGLTTTKNSTPTPTTTTTNSTISTRSKTTTTTAKTLTTISTASSPPKNTLASSTILTRSRRSGVTSADKINSTSTNKKRKTM